MSISIDLLDVFRGLVQKYNIQIKHNELPKNPSCLIVDIEHDECGNFVCVGCAVLSSDVVYSIFDLSLLTSFDFSAVKIIGHNVLGDVALLKQWGVNVNTRNIIHDTMLYAHIFDSSSRMYGLKDVAKRDLGIEYPSYEDIVGKRTKKQSKERITLDQQPQELTALYNAMDVYTTNKLYEKQKPLKNKQSDTFFENISLPVAQVFKQMEDRGVCVDVPYLKALQTELEAQKVPLVKEIDKAIGPINLNSPKQLLGALHAKGIKPTFKGKDSTDKRALDTLRHLPEVQLLIKYSEIETLCSSFVTPYLERNQDVVHPFFNTCGTRTGRPSCSNPNLLQIPKRTDNGKKVRRMFKARDGMYLGDCDYGQIEPRVLAHLSKDPVLCRMFNDGTDFHTFTSERLLISRDRAKILNLSVGYRATKYSVSRQLGGSLEEAQIEIDRWWSMFPALRRWQDELIWKAKKTGLCTTLFGRNIRVDGLAENVFWKREAAERQLINNIAQGSAAEIIQKAMIDIVEDKEGFKFAPQFGLLIQVYDELVFESPNPYDIEGVKEYMTHATKIEVPLVVEGGIGMNWADIK